MTRLERLAGRNTSAYYEHLNIMAIKSFMMLSTGLLEALGYKQSHLYSSVQGAKVSRAISLALYC
jgi:hypothetical protein